MKTVLLFVPHEDDEINLAGATIVRLKEEGARVICAFLTNGDWLYSAKVRFVEALASLSALGVPENDAVFLGYPDGGTLGERSLFMHKKDTPLEAAGHTETYGAAAHPDFASAVRGHPTPYTWDGLLSDIEALLLHFKPDTIIGTDFDRHPDHRMASLALDTVMGRMLNRKGNDYFPIYLKGFAYSTAFEAEDTLFTESHTPAAAVNPAALSYPDYGTDNPAFPWEARLRFAVPASCRTIDMKENRLFRALSSYISQRIFVRVGRIAKGDQVFWQRRTDSLTHGARLSATSGDPSHLTDFRTIYTENITAGAPVFSGDAWTPDDTDTKKSVTATFDAPHTISAISLWGSAYETGKTRVTLHFGNGYETETALSEKGRETKIEIPPQNHISEVTLTVTAGCGAITEWDLYETKSQPVPLLHILANDRFAYEDCTVWPGETPPEISAYTHDIEEPIRWFLNGAETTLSDIQKAVDNLKQPLQIRAEAGALSHEIRIEKKSHFDLMKYKLKQKAAILYIEKVRLQHESRHHAMKQAAKKEKKNILTSGGNP